MTSYVQCHVSVYRSIINIAMTANNVLPYQDGVAIQLTGQTTQAVPAPNISFSY